ncbi:MAG: hypothetical protein KDH88_08785 [Chromatiales bacterium]|nr:hypothetical protein [Chromatiales bacterium]
MKPSAKHAITGTLAVSATCLSLVTYADSVEPASKRHNETAVCSRTAFDLYAACTADIHEEYRIADANCNNIVDGSERAECRLERNEALSEGKRECIEQRRARTDLCSALGEDAYDPQIDPANFVDPLLIGDTVAPNSYFPLTPGLVRVYESGEETITVTVTDETVEIAGVSCIVVRDIVQEGDEVIEDTMDWYAQDIEGNVWYFGELALNFEDGFVTDIDGSFRAGIDRAKPGILMFAAPQVGDIYRQEFALGEAEDVAEVLSTGADESAAAASCNFACLQTRDFTPLEPGVEEYKFYAPGIGPIVEYHVDDPEDRVELISVELP